MKDKFAESLIKEKVVPLKFKLGFGDRIRIHQQDIDILLGNMTVRITNALNTFKRITKQKTGNVNLGEVHRQSDMYKMKLRDLLAYKQIVDPNTGKKTLGLPLENLQKL